MHKLKQILLQRPSLEPEDYNKLKNFAKIFIQLRDTKP